MSSFTSSVVTCSTSWSTRTPLRRPAHLLVQRDEYLYVGPFVEDEHAVFLKTTILSRKATKQYLDEESDDEA